ncbi:hypothetical protein [Algibacter mikhailovii]|uniref:AraC family transcriptional regulator n=1 Tax=Algibacter mikhailovii TaxID=425498 RepID=A0A918V7D7_9FLAO|nr:hypothetical protein [Algibacter mikhailovii]GGZ72510.1 hypothetical protein GCM10007028_06920 [Algibacter mikhailovii]
MKITISILAIFFTLSATSQSKNQNYKQTPFKKWNKLQSIDSTGQYINSYFKTTTAYGESYNMITDEKIECEFVLLIDVDEFHVRVAHKGIPGMLTFDDLDITEVILLTPDHKSHKLPAYRGKYGIFFYNTKLFKHKTELLKLMQNAGKYGMTFYSNESKESTKYFLTFKI